MKSAIEKRTRRGRQPDTSRAGYFDNGRCWPSAGRRLTLLGHRAHTEEIILGRRSADQWAYYPGEGNPPPNYELFVDELSSSSLQDAKQVDAIRQKYTKEIERYSDELKEIQAEKPRRPSRSENRRGPRGSFRSGGRLLEAGADLSSITLLTRKKIFWVFGDRAVAHRDHHRRHRPADSLARNC